MEPITFISTGGTIDKVYFDASSAFEVGESVLEHILREGRVGFEIDQVALLRKDSLDLTDADRAAIRDTIASHPHRHFVVTHGTDTMTDTAAALQDLDDRVIVLTGALAPARFKSTDAVFNVGLAVGAVQTLPPGVYIAMNGRVFEADKVRKNQQEKRFEAIAGGDAEAFNEGANS